MSSKKVASKDSKSKKAPAPAAKGAAKSAAKPAAKSAAKAPASAAKKPAEKAVKKAAPAAKKETPAKKAPAAKVAPAPKTASKKVEAKENPKASAKKAVDAKVAATEKKASKTSIKTTAAKDAAKVSEKVTAKAKAADKTAEKSTSKKATPVAEKPAVKDEPKVSVEKVVKAPAETATATVEDKGSDVKKKNAPDYAYAVLLQGVKRLSKTIMFVKVDESEDRSNKKKMSSDVKNLDMKPTSPIRHKASLAEETQEELTERILKELEEQNRLFEREAATQMCTRCNRNLVSPEFWVDKHLGFCEECATILKLGQSKEARKVEYQLGAMDGDSLDEEDDDIIGPDADDLKAAEEDLADMDD